MRIQTQNHLTPPVSRKPIASDERAPQVTGHDMLLLSEIFHLRLRNLRPSWLGAIDTSPIFFPELFSIRISAYSEAV